MIKYETITIIKQDNRGLVCLASMPKFNEPVIIKIRKSASLSVCRQLAEIKSRHIPKIYSCEEDGDSIIIAEEYVEGKSLDDYVKTHSCSETEITALMLQLCNCMKLLHSQTPPIIHRDLKPQNILVTEDGIVKIIDFDASRNFNSDSSRDTHLLGTDGYAPPEQFGYAQTDIRSDVYATGIILYELLFGKKFPVNRKDLPKKELYPITGHSKLTRRLVSVIKKCTQFHPDSRYADMAHLEKALHAALKPPVPKIIPAAVFAGIICLATGFLHFTKADVPSSRNAPVPPATESTEVRLPTYTADCFDEETGTSVPFVLYYRQDKPEETPFYFSFPHGGAAPHTVSLCDNTSGKSINIVNEHWNYDRDTYLLHIEDDYLTKLKPDREYTVTCLWDDLRWNVNLYPLSSLEKLETLDGVALSPGWLEFKKEDPHDYIAASVNAFGRKINGIFWGDERNVLDKKYYSINEEGTILTISQDFFNQFETGEVFSIFFTFTDDARFTANPELSIDVEIR